MAHNIYIVEDHTFMREMIRVYIQREPDLNVCGLAASAEEAAGDLVDTQADLILIDMSLPEMSGVDLVRLLLDRQPRQRCLIYSGHEESSYVERALKAGSWGYLLKAMPAELIKAIRHVIGGEAYLSEALRGNGSERGALLTPDIRDDLGRGRDSNRGPDGRGLV